MHERLRALGRESCSRESCSRVRTRIAARARYILGTYCSTLLPRPTDHALTTQEKRQSSAEAVAGRQAAMLYQIEELEAADEKRREVEEMMAQACILSVSCTKCSHST